MAKYTDVQLDQFVDVARMFHKQLIDEDELRAMMAAIEDDPAYADDFDGEYCCGVPIDA